MSFDGFINLNKGQGITSQTAVAAIKRLLHVKAGHCGTLDPDATGVLPICLGKATRLSTLVMGQTKTYAGRICFGIATSTYDAAGEILAQADASSLTEAKLIEILPAFCGEIEQIPPMVSAIKKGGIPLYKLARQGEQLDLAPRRVEIYAIRLQCFSPGELAYADIEIDCGTGTYIRSLAFDIGQALGLPAHLCALQRSKTGDFAIADSYTLEQIQQLIAEGDMSFILPVNEVIDFIPAVTVSDKSISAISHGHDLPYQGALPPASAVRVVAEDKRLLAMGRISHKAENRVIKMEKVLIDAYDDIAIAIGNFDGLHLGHRALFEQLAAMKKSLGSKSEILTFDPHPLTLIKGDAPQLLTGEKLKLSLLVDYFAIDKVVPMEFTPELMNISPENFVREIIVEKLKANHLIVGYNFTFAEGGIGDAALLRQLCGEYNIDVTIVDEVESAFGVISSSNIRKHLLAGDLAAVNEMLGYWFALEGEVVYGNQLGHTFGYPTANFYPEQNQAVPRNGVYAAKIEHNGQTYDGVVNFGVKPTVGGITRPLIEAHLFDIDLDLYGQKIRTWLGQYLRPEQKFKDFEQLKAQMKQDSVKAREFLAHVAANKHLPKRI